ncbi:MULTISPECIES: OmpA family protein [Neisseria]|nr:OmpA family protein [Neisseria arctica]UOO87319.1 OmpA family protein [Neisseria arctica]
MMFSRRHLVWVLLPFFATGCVTHSKVTWVDTKDIVYSTSVPEGRSSVVFYRSSDAIDGPTVNIYVNGEYLGSLQPNAYRQETVCAQNQRFHADFTNQDRAYRKKADLGDYYNLPEAAVSFFKITNNNGQPALEPVTPEQAEADLKGVQQQNHTLSRVSKASQCAEVLKKYSLQASALFKFDRSEYKDMLPQGKREVAAVSDDIKQNLNRVSSISVIGHTDPEGSDIYNNKLSTARAATVKKALMESGLQGGMIVAEGRGKKELLVTNCRAQHPKNAKARQECDQPNRRVEILLHGEKAAK